MYNPFIDSAILIFFFMVFMYVIATIKKDNSIADIGWGIGFVLVSLWMHINYGKSMLLLIMVAIWGSRLAAYLFFRNRKSGEDWRYKKWREEWGKMVWFRAFFQVFMLQGFFMWMIALPIMLGKENAFSLFQLLGIGFWTLGFLWETIADLQLMQFKKLPKNKGKVLDKGLWKLSRHPNYFGEIILWWGLYLFILPNEMWYVAMIGPFTITWLLSRVSGVPMAGEEIQRQTGLPEIYSINECTDSHFEKIENLSRCFSGGEEV